MRLIDFVSERHIVTELRGTTKVDVLAELVEVLLRDSNVNEKLALKKVLAREKIESTGMGRRVAMPHASIPGLTRLTCAVGIVNQGIDFESIDKEPVQLIFFVCDPLNQPTVHLNFLATLARILRDDDVVESLVKAQTSTEIFQLLEVYGGSMINPEDQVARQREAAASIDSTAGAFDCPEIVLLARLELCSDMLTSTENCRDDARSRVENIKALLNPATIDKFERFRRRGRRAVVTVEGRACQGCHRKIPTQRVRELCADDSTLHNCPHCGRFIYTYAA